VTDDGTTRVQPPESAAGAPFWAGTRERRFTLPWCRACGRPHWFPREVCPHCLSDDLDWREASGRGAVHAVSVMPAGGAGGAARGPYAVALVDLEEGVRLMTEVIGCDPETVAVGLPVRLVWQPLGDGRHLHLFEPDR